MSVRVRSREPYVAKSITKAQYPLIPTDLLVLELNYRVIIANNLVRLVDRFRKQLGKTKPLSGHLVAVYKSRISPAIVSCSQKLVSTHHWHIQIDHRTHML